CHFNGGGGIGPPLMDDQWIYGSDPANVFASIVEGRPNGMPAYRDRIPDADVWKIVAYVRSLSGQVRMDVAPGRPDAMTTRKTPELTPEREPKPVGYPATD
ncbi:MAG: c-type cytochrome, partial [Limisphaerales bacterium]